jgi:alpha-tubulin suppressor-like RCC1 family protein
MEALARFRIRRSRRRGSSILLAGLVVVLTMALAAPASASLKRWGQYFGGGETQTQAEPTPVTGLEHVTAIDASNATSYALESNGLVYAWGNGRFGQLGNGGAANSPTPVRVGFPSGVVIVAIGEARDQGYAVDSTGQGWAWGYNGHGSLCLGVAAMRLRPEKVPGITTATAVQGGENHVLWLLNNGTVESCGTNVQGQLGVGSRVQQSNVPLAVPGLTGIVRVSVGEHTSAALDSSGRLFMWGGNETGAVGVGQQFRDVYTPMQVQLPAGAGAVTDVSAGGDFGENDHTLALVGGELYGWGQDSLNQVGDEAMSDGSGENKFEPVPTGLHFAQVVAGGAHSLGLDASGNVWAWGAGYGFALGTGTSKGILTPVIVDTGVSVISATATNSIDSSEGTLGG